MYAEVSAIHELGISTHKRSWLELVGGAILAGPRQIYLRVTYQCCEVSQTMYSLSSPTKKVKVVEDPFVLEV